MWWLLACNGPGPDSGSVESVAESAAHSQDPSTPVRHEGPGGGYGFRLASDGERVWTSAPWGETGDVYVLGEADPVATGGTSYGYTLASGPVADEPFTDGVTARIEGASATATTTTFGDVTTEHPSPPSALAWADDAPVVAFLRGDHALWVDGLLVARDVPLQGEAVCAADIDEDGVTEVLVGGGDRVDVLGDGVLEPFLQGEGRFGAALACDDGVLVIGAPQARAQAGVVWAWRGGELTELLVGEVGDGLGASVLLVGDRVYAGAPTGDAVVEGLLE